MSKELTIQEQIAKEIFYGHVSDELPWEQAKELYPTIYEVSYRSAAQILATLKAAGWRKVSGGGK